MIDGVMIAGFDRGRSPSHRATGVEVEPAADQRIAAEWAMLCTVHNILKLAGAAAAA